MTRKAEVDFSARCPKDRWGKLSSTMDAAVMIPARVSIRTFFQLGAGVGPIGGGQGRKCAEQGRRRLHKKCLLFMRRRRCIKEGEERPDRLGHDPQFQTGRTGAAGPLASARFPCSSGMRAAYRKGCLLFVRPTTPVGTALYAIQPYSANKAIIHQATAFCKRNCEKRLRA